MGLMRAWAWPGCLIGHGLGLRPGLLHIVTKLNFATTTSAGSQLNNIPGPRMTLTVMSDDDAVTAITVQRPVQPNTAPTTNPHNAKQNADNAGWSSSLSNQDEDLDNDDSNKSVYKGTHEDSIDHDIDITGNGDDENNNNSNSFLQDINVQDIAVPRMVQREEKTRDVNTFFGKSYAHKAKDGKTRNVRDCETCKKKGSPSQIVSDASTCRHHLAFRHMDAYHKWCKANKFASMLPQDIKECKTAAAVATHTSCGPPQFQEDIDVTSCAVHSVHIPNHKATQAEIMDLFKKQMTNKAPCYNPQHADLSVPQENGCHDEVGLIRAIAVKEQSSAQCKHLFKDIQARPPNPSPVVSQLLLDMPIRWSSTYVMLDRAEKKKVLDYVKATSQNHADNAQQSFSSDRGPSLQQALPALEALHKAWSSRSANPRYKAFHIALNAAVEKIKQYYDRTSDSEAYIMSMLLDPSQKDTHFKRFWGKTLHAEALDEAERIVID
ncbi:uncharacterized protein EDB93DRAFT_1103831 [Suillus bovinus]|uniref:uncharacterized protein n=1 Tax=Suillus bovinus TaxID=48563 RepID=UPI001B8703CC|nr:uncharacterized protein EDB93DRAFT_1103831 [Suillus bovinus]KAG2148168.1 hypothetical protein EDB93DRAFT_1103831 [Suillus bovinus]